MAGKWVRMTVGGAVGRGGEGCGGGGGVRGV